MFNNYNIPGDIGIIPSNQTIKIGLLEDLNDISGSSAWKGAYLAAKEINEAGGISINGSLYYVGLTSENTFEQELNLDITKGIDSANNLITNYNPDFIIGGSNYFASSAYLEPIMDTKIPFINIGVFSTNFSQKVLDNYTRYKYLFNKVNNNSRIEYELITYENYLANYLSANLSRSINKIAFLSDKTYLIPQLIEGMKTSLSSFGIEAVKEITYSYTTTKDDFIDYWNEIDNAGAQLTFVIGFTDNVKLISETYGEVKPRCLLLNYNKFNPHNTYWDDTNEGCEYEIAYQATFNTSRTSRSIAFWNQFINEYHHDPYFWSASAYDAIHLIENATSDSQSLNASKIIKSLEKINTSNSFPGIHGKIAFTNSHGLSNGLDYPSAMMCQWQAGGSKVVLPNNNLIYSDTLATGSLEIPYWGINIHFTINSPNENNIFEEMAPVFNIEILDTVDKIWYTLNSGTEKYFINNNGTIDQLTWEDQLSDGPVRITFYSNDTSGHIYRRYVNVIRDTLPPSVTIEPMDTTTFGSEAPTITLNIQDATNISESYYSLDGGVTKIPFTGNVVTINQTLWDELGEGLITIAFYIIDALDKETIVYVDVYKELPGEDNFLLYIIIGIIALGLGVLITITYTQYRRKKRRKTEWIKLKKKKGLISPEVVEGKNLIFISYTTKDSDLFQIPLITDILVQYPEIDDILYWESDMHDDIYEYMDDTLKLCSVILLFCTQNSLYSEPVKIEWRSALKLDKKIIPIFINPNDIPPLLTTKLGVQFKESEVYDSIEEIYQMILKKLEIVSTREYCKYLIPKLVSDEYFEEQTAPMVKKDIEIECDVPIEDLQMQFISILENNNFQLLEKPIDTEEIEKSEELSKRLNENNLINLRFFAEDKFQKQEIGLSITIQKGEDYPSKVYIRVMGNKEWMVDDIISDLNNKCYRLKTVKELLREYLDKIEEFIDYIDIEGFLRKNFGTEIEEIEELMYQC
ncbi:MAG: ABC transporter substrate-binding protein, partial [Candidatus Hodarchaeota archaeon]